MTDAPKTLAELEQQIADAKLSIAKLEVTPLQAIHDELAKINFAPLMEVIQTNLSNLTEERRQQAFNIMTVLHHSPFFLIEETNRLNQMITAQETPASEALIEAAIVEPPVEE